jgi:hypothetical protein
MGNGILTFNDFFEMNEVAGKSEQFFNSQAFQNVKQKLTEEAKGVKLSKGFQEGMFNLMLDKLVELLEINIPKDVLAEAWSKHKSLQEYRDGEKHPPEKTALVPLVEHSLKTSHAPSMEVTMFERTLGTLVLQIEAKFLIKGVILEISNARIMKLRLSEIDGNIKLQFLGVPFLEKKTTLKLPGVFDLKEGVAIRDPFERKQKAEAETAVLSAAPSQKQLEKAV